jgi:hypothetical protein
MSSCRANWLMGTVLCAAASFGTAHAQTLTIADLDGLVIESELTREQVNRFNGREVVATVDLTWSVEIGPGPFLKSTSKNQIRGRPAEAPLSGLFRLGEPQQVGSFGGGDAQWTLKDDSLTFTRTFKQGANRFSIALARKDSGFECTAVQSFAREDGSGQIVFWGPGVRTDVTIVSWRQLSSTCRVSKR